MIAKIEELLPYIEKYGKAEEHLTTLNTTFPEALKKSILQEAVQGKLVPQNPGDEPASVLLERIRAEKKRLVKEGKIKKDKHESVIITRDKIPYEILDGKERCIADEVPFELPESWCWCRFNDLYSLSNGTASRGSKDGQDCAVLRLADLSNGIIDSKDIRIIKLTEKEYQSHKLQKGDIILIRVNGSKDRVATAFYYDEESTISYCDHLFCGHRTSSIIYAKYIMHLFNSAIIRKQVIPEIKTTAGQNTISQASLNSIFIPLPPLAEQKRIVNKIEELMQYCNKL